ncbi:hypothetical protein L917_21605 [Phytophthora nicotianae]|uniref:Uncharacterized protein n=1 Tax=Phytophthora nicotianae TaxID=4792 RepID=W2JWY7_PHYNI|nr:hypothetical protein L917_21605 [Phytophthora nicotianae]
MLNANAKLAGPNALTDQTLQSLDYYIDPPPEDASIYPD